MVHDEYEAVVMFVSQAVMDADFHNVTDRASIVSDFEVVQWVSNKSKNLEVLFLCLNQYESMI